MSDERPSAAEIMSDRQPTPDETINRTTKRRSAFPSFVARRSTGSRTTPKVTVRVRHFNSRNNEPWLIASFTDLVTDVRPTIQALIDQVATRPNSELYYNSDHNDPGRQISLEEIARIIMESSVLVGGSVEDLEIVVGEPRRSATPIGMPPHPRPREQEREKPKCCIIL